MFFVLHLSFDWFVTPCPSSSKVHCTNWFTMFKNLSPNFIEEPTIHFTSWMQDFSLGKLIKNSKPTTMYVKATKK